FRGRVMHKVLIVDDDNEILKMMQTALKMKNYEVVVYQEISVPLDIEKFRGFDLILLDIMMTNIEGTEICKRIRKEISTPIILPRTIHGIGSKREMPSRCYIKIFAI
ncbi:MAG: response regulator, partial [Tannerella forsythia]|uniref:response regulator n=1 Tax=Tannerella forsythia TaxID=28112 RepID=UPI00361F1246